MTICKEMIKLRKYLDDKGIKWVDESTDDNLCICRTHFELNGFRWSVINDYGTYGGVILDGRNLGLLELMINSVNGGDPVGFLKADDVIDYIEQLKAGGENEMCK